MNLNLLFLLHIIASCKSDPSVPVTEERRRKAEKYLSSLSVNREDWINPNDMFNFKGVDYGNIIDVPESSSLIKENEVDNSAPTTSNNDKVSGENVDPSDKAQNEKMNKLTEETKRNSSLSDIFVSKWVKKFMRKVNDLSDKLMESAYIQFPINEQLFERLNDILDKEPLNVPELNEIIESAILEAVLVQKSSTYQFDVISGFLTSNWEVVIVFVIFLTFLTLFYAVVRSSKLMLCGLFVCISVFWHWMHRYKQKVAEKHYKLESIDFDSECRIKDSGMLRQMELYFKSFFKAGNECEKYYKALMVDPIWDVSISVAVSDTFSSFVLHPVKVMADVGNASIKALFSDLTILQSAVILFFAIFILIMMCSYKIRLPWFFACFEPAVTTSGVQEVVFTERMKNLSNGSSIGVKAQNEAAIYEEEEYHVNLGILKSRKPPNALQRECSETGSMQVKGLSRSKSLLDIRPAIGCNISEAAELERVKADLKRFAM